MTDARALASRLADLLGREHAAMAEFVVALAEFDGRRSWAELGYASLFDFLHRELGLSKGAAHYRKTAAELVQKFPEIVEPLRDGRLCITSIVHLAKVITPENRQQMLPKFLHCSKREAMAVAAAVQPASAAPHRDVVTAVRTAPAAILTSAALLTEPAAPSPSASQLDAAVQPVELTISSSAPAEMSASAPTGAAQGSLLQKPPRCDSSEPLTAELSRLHVTVSKRFLDKLEAARSALSHSRPGASAEAILEAGLDLVLDRHARRKGLVKKPRPEKAGAKGPDWAGAKGPDWAGAKAPDRAGAKYADRAGGSPDRSAASPGTSAASPGTSGASPGTSGASPDRSAAKSRDGPPANPPALTAAVKRQVWTRDRGRCRWPLESGGICGSTLRVEFDHVIPRAAGGPSTTENVRLLCRVHNDLAARRAFGDDWMDQFTRGTATPGTNETNTGGANAMSTGRAGTMGSDPAGAAEHGFAPPIEGMAPG